MRETAYDHDSIRQTECICDRECMSNNGFAVLNSLEDDTGMNKTSFGKGLQDGIPIGLGYFAVSLPLGSWLFSRSDFMAGSLIHVKSYLGQGQFAGIGSLQPVVRVGDGMTQWLST